MKRLLLVLALIVVAFSGCTESGPSAEELKTLAVKSSDNLSSYSLTSSVDQTVKIVPPEEGNIANATEISESLGTLATVDLVAYEAKVIGTRTNIIKLPGEEGNSTSSQATVYQIGNSTYIKEDSGIWTRLVDPRSAEDIWGQGQNNQIMNLAESINQSQIEVVGSEKIDGEDCYKLEILPGSNEYYNLYSNAFSIAISLVEYPLLIPSINRTELNESSEIEKFVWISKQTNWPKKYQSSMSFDISPIVTGGVDPSTGEMRKFNETLVLGKVSVKIESIDLYSDINKPAEIDLPDEALKAEPTYPTPLELAPAI